MSDEGPDHYRQGSIEPLDYTESREDWFPGYCIGNIHKYLYRYNSKGGMRDLAKAKVYLGRLEAFELKRHGADWCPEKETP